MADFVTLAGRAEAAGIAGRSAAPSMSWLTPGSAAYALLVSRDVLSPAAPQWRELSALLAARPYLGDLRRLQEALTAIAESGQGEDQ